MRACYLIGIGGMSSLMVAGLAPPSSGRHSVSTRAPAAPMMFDDGNSNLQISTRLTQHKLLGKTVKSPYVVTLVSAECLRVFSTLLPVFCAWLWQ